MKYIIRVYKIIEENMSDDKKKHGVNRCRLTIIKEKDNILNVSLINIKKHTA